MQVKYNYSLRRDAESGVAGTKLKVWRETRVRREVSLNFFVLPLHCFGTAVQLVVLVIVRTVRSVSRLLFFYSRCPHAQPFVK